MSTARTHVALDEFILRLHFFCMWLHVPLQLHNDMHGCPFMMHLQGRLHSILQWHNANSGNFKDFTGLLVYRGVGGTLSFPCIHPHSTGGGKEGRATRQFPQIWPLCKRCKEGIRSNINNLSLNNDLSTYQALLSLLTISTIVSGGSL